MYSAQKTVPDTSSNMNVDAVQLSNENREIGGYFSFTVLSGPTVFFWWKTDESAPAPTAAFVVANGFPVHESTGQPISVQDPNERANPSKLYLACASGGGGSDFRATA